MAAQSQVLRQMEHLLAHLFRPLWNFLSGSVWGRLAATVLIAVSGVTIVWCKQNNEHLHYFRLLGMAVVMSVVGELYLEMMSRRREKTADGSLKLTWGDLVLMILFFAVVIVLVGWFFVG
jgi:hypothetical protein